MSSVTARNTSGVSVVAVRTTPLTRSSYVNGLGAWVSATDWDIDTSGDTEGTYSAADERRYLTSTVASSAASTNVSVAYSAAADNVSSGAVRWGLPRTVGAASDTKLITVFAPASH